MKIFVALLRGLRENGLPKTRVRRAKCFGVAEGIYRRSSKPTVGATSYRKGSHQLLGLGYHVLLLGHITKKGVND